MPSKLSPELVVAKYIKSATNGRILTVRWRRILTLFLLPIWIVGFIFSGIIEYDGIISFSKVAEIENRRKMNMANIPFSADMGKEISKIDDEYNYDMLQNDKRVNVLYFPAFVTICFGVPWVILRLMFWIIDADNAENELHQ